MFELPSARQLRRDRSPGAQFISSSDVDQKEAEHRSPAEANYLHIPKKLDGYPQAKLQDEHSDFLQAADVPVLDVASPQAAITPDLLLAERQFTQFSLPERRTKLWWLAAAVPGVGIWALGSASGHPLVGIGVLAGAAGACALVAWGNWVLDNTIM